MRLSPRLKSKYVSRELTQSLFRFLLQQLVSPKAGLAHPENSVYKDTVYILDSLSTVKSVVLICDLPSAHDLLTEYFQKLWTLTRYVGATLTKVRRWPRMSSSHLLIS